MQRVRKPKAREVVMVALLSALTVIGNLISLSVLPIQAGTGMVILSGVAFGPVVGFVVGALGRLVSNFFQGQGIWTIWQMMTWGLLGILSGIFFRRNDFISDKKKQGWKPTDAKLCIYTFLVVFLVYGGVMNLATIFMSAVGPESFTWEAIKAVYLAGLPFDLWHGVRSTIFVLFFGKSILQKLERVKIKYGFYRIRR